MRVNYWVEVSPSGLIGIPENLAIAPGIRSGVSEITLAAPNAGLRLANIYGEDNWKPLLDAMEVDDPLNFKNIGSWDRDTGEVVTGHTYSHLLNYMPPVWDGISGPDAPVYIPATEVTDVLLMYGQHPREFII